MKMSFLRSLMLAAVFAVLAVVATVPVIAAPAPGVEFAVLELTQSPDGTFNLTKAMDSNTPLELAVLYVNLDDPTGYVIVKNNALLKTWAEDAVQFTNSDTSSATFRRVLTIDTKNGSYVLMVINHAMNTEVPLPTTVLARADTDQTGGYMYQVNNKFDGRAATIDQDTSGAWVITR